LDIVVGIQVWKKEGKKERERRGYLLREGGWRGQGKRDMTPGTVAMPGTKGAGRTGTMNGG
jgi:hypothetical protein